MQSSTRRRIAAAHRLVSLVGPGWRHLGKRGLQRFTQRTGQIDGV
jgi:hypothetical protein